MLLVTHLSFALLIGLILKDNFPFMIAVIVGTLIPDLDLYFKKVPILRKYIKHRGFMHGLPFLALLCLIVFIFFDLYMMAGLAAGYLSHMILDMTTPKGVTILYPFSKARVKGFIRTGSAAEYIFLVILIAADLVLLL